MGILMVNLMPLSALLVAYGFVWLTSGCLHVVSGDKKYFTAFDHAFSLLANSSGSPVVVCMLSRQISSTLLPFDHNLPLLEMSPGSPVGVCIVSQK